MPTTTKPTSKAVETLAEWMHEQFIATSRAPVVPLWAGLSKESKAKYRRVAKRMLESPPDVLREAVNRKTNSHE
jgi:hypothetical protein